MSVMTTPRTPGQIIYPDSDGQPMADNTLQFRWIVIIKENLEALFRNDPNVFVAGDLLWYPVEGRPEVRAAPDAMVVFGRPKGERGSYRQWEEAGIAPQVVFEVLSPGNRHNEMIRKFRFYEQYGVEEYYVYDPDDGRCDGWLRTNGILEEIPDMHGWVSPRLGIRFDLSGSELLLSGPDGQVFGTLTQALEQAAAAREQAAAATARAERLAARLRELGIEPEV